MANITAACKECGTEFEILESEQAFFKNKGLQIPKRCKACRDARKKASQETPSSKGVEGRS